VLVPPHHDQWEIRTCGSKELVPLGSKIVHTDGARNAVDDSVGEVETWL
jgi:hypothetical protein